MTPFERILDAVSDACKAVPEVAGNVYVERQTKLDSTRMPGVIVWPGAVSAGRLGHDTSALRFAFRIDLFCAGERPSSQFYGLAAAVHAALLDSAVLPQLVAELPEPTLDEPIYGDFDGFAGYVPIRYTVTVVTDRRDLTQLT
jgi:hypothetical protein